MQVLAIAQVDLGGKAYRLPETEENNTFDAKELEERSV